MVLIAAAVRTGRVLFSTTIVWPLAAWACAAQASTQRRSLAWPAPSFRLRGGVHRNEHHARIRNRDFYGRGKAGIAPTCPPHHCIQARLINRQAAQILVVVASIRAWLRSTTVTCNGQHQQSPPWLGRPHTQHLCSRCVESSHPRLISKCRTLERIDRRVQALLQ